MDREVRGGLMHGIRTWWQLPGSVCVKGNMSDLHATKPWIRHVDDVVSACIQTWSCNLTCGARSAAAHAYGHTASCHTFLRVFENSHSASFESTPREGSDRVKSVQTWVYLRRSGKGSYRRRRIWGQCHVQPTTEL
ncbi:hypothetical protein F2Q69_00005579 [Brassica cretica]|uniref:Uncharacterized protein n=1 Tax=Brassica cretica TaxID=69181 RepID=A0A8S9PAA6_BRACR|nr:hypothetical protein F2Q69_00005579 [Brassica cretica]